MGFAAETLDNPSISVPAFYWNHFSHVSTKFRYHYQSTPKVASSSLLTTLHRLELGAPDFAHSPPGEVHSRVNSPLIRLDEVTGTFAREPLFRFCVVRNPVDRFISAYLDKVHPEAGGLGPMVRSALGLGEDEAVTLDHFADAALTQAYEDMDPHYAVQSWHLAMSAVDYDLVGRFEQYDEVLAVIGARLGVDMALWESRIDHHKTGPKDYARRLSPGLMDKIVTLYREDFDRFGYPTDIAAYVG